jgi:hypothetical protein
MTKQVSRKEIIITMIIIAVIVLLGFLEQELFGGSELFHMKQNARVTDALSYFMFFGLGLFCIIFQGLRLGSPLFGAMLGTLVVLVLLVPPIIAGRMAEGAAFPILLIFLVAIGLGVGTSLLGRKLPDMSASIQARIWGLTFLSSGVVLFLIGQELPKGIPWGILAWLLQGLGIYLGIFLGILKIVRGR